MTKQNVVVTYLLTGFWRLEGGARLDQYYLEVKNETNTQCTRSMKAKGPQSRETVEGHLSSLV